MQDLSSVVEKESSHLGVLFQQKPEEELSTGLSEREEQRLSEISFPDALKFSLQADVLKNNLKNSKNAFLVLLSGMAEPSFEQLLTFKKPDLQLDNIPMTGLDLSFLDRKGER